MSRSSPEPTEKVAREVGDAFAPSFGGLVEHGDERCARRFVVAVGWAKLEHVPVALEVDSPLFLFDHVGGHVGFIGLHADV